MMTYEQAKSRGVQAEWWVSAGKQLPQMLLWKTHHCLLTCWALVCVPQMDLSARLLSKRAAWADTLEKYTMRKAGSSQGPHSVKGSWWEPGTHGSLSCPFHDGGCAGPWCGITSSSHLLRSTPLETTHRIVRNKVCTFSFSSVT